MSKPSWLKTGYDLYEHPDYKELKQIEDRSQRERLPMLKPPVINKKPSYITAPEKVELPKLSANLNIKNSSINYNGDNLKSYNPSKYIDEPNWAESLFNALMQGVSSTAASLTNIPKKLAEIGDTLEPITKPIEDKINSTPFKYTKNIARALPIVGNAMNVIDNIELAQRNGKQISNTYNKLDNADQYWQNKNKDITGAKKVVSDAVSSLPEMLLNFVPGVGTALFGVSAGSGYARNAEKEGANLSQQLAYGAAGGLIENATEKIPLDWIKNTAAGKWVNAGAKNLLGKFGDGALQYLGDIATEFTQEAITDPLTNTAKKVIYDPNTKIVDTSQMLSSGVTGGVMGAILGAMALPMGYKSRRMAEMIIKNKAPANEQVVGLLQDQIKEDLQNVKSTDDLDNVLNMPELGEQQSSMNNTAIDNSNPVNANSGINIEDMNNTNVNNSNLNNSNVNNVGNIIAENSQTTPKTELPMLTKANKLNINAESIKSKKNVVPKSPTTSVNNKGNTNIPIEQNTAVNESTKATNGIKENSDNNSQTLDINSINIDPKRFQFKSDVDKTTGAGKDISDIEKWDDNLAGRITVWQDKEGKLWVVNGHHRLNMAKKLGVKSIDAKILRETDGITDKEARETGAKINLAEGRGTSIDAAKVFRDGDYTIDSLKKSGLSFKEKLVNNGYNIAQLNDRLFNKVVNKTLSEEQGAIIGEAFPKDSKNYETNQNAAMDYIGKHNGDITNYKLKEVVDGIKNSSITSTQQTTLFGAETVFNNSFENKVDIVSSVKRKLGLERNLFTNLVNSKKAEAALKAGNSLNAKANEKSKLIAERSLEFIDKDKWYPSTPIGGIIDKYANLMNADMKLNKAADEAFEEIKKIIETGDFLKPKEDSKIESKIDENQINMFGGVENGKRKDRQGNERTDETANRGRESNLGKTEKVSSGEEKNGDAERKDTSKTEKVVFNNKEVLNKKVTIVNADNLNVLSIDNYENPVKDIKKYSLANLRGIYHNIDQNIDIIITRSGIKETLSKIVSDEKLETMPILPDLIENAVKFNESNETKGREVDKWHYFVSGLKYKENLYSVLIDVREINKEHQFYIHKMRIIKMSDNHTVPQNNSETSLPLPSDISTISVGDLLKDVKVNSAQSDVKNSGTEIINNRDTITIERVNKEPFVVHKGDRVKVFLGKIDGTKKYGVGTVVGISHANKTVKVKYDNSLTDSKGLDISKNFIYPIDIEKPKETQNITSLSNVIEDVNKLNEPEGRFTEADKVPQQTKNDKLPMPVNANNPFTRSKELTSKLSKGKNISYTEALKEIDYVLNKEEDIKQALSKLKNDELKKMASYLVTSYKKADMVKDIYVNELSHIYYSISGENTLSYGFTGERTEDIIKGKIKNVLEDLNEDSFNKVMEQNKKEYEGKLSKRRKEAETIKNPQTLKEFEKTKKLRLLTKEEQRKYDELKALADKEKQKEKNITNKIETNNDYTIEKTKDTRDNKNLWVVKFKQKSDDFKSLNKQMKELGGAGYSRFTKGFNFYFDPSEKLNNLKSGNSVENTKEEVKTDRKKETADKLRTIADNMQKSIDEKLAERKVNTARRARMAASVEADGRYLKKIQGITRDIADAIEKGEVTYLDGINARSHIETLNSLLTKAKNETEKLNNISYADSKEREISIDDIDNASYPYPTVYSSDMRKLYEMTEGLKGVGNGRKEAIRLYRVIMQNNKDNYIKLNDKTAETIINLNNLAKKNGKDGIRINYEEDYKRLKAMGINSIESLRAALREFYKYSESAKLTEKDKKQAKVKELERNIIGRKIDGYFPTPKNVVNKMLDLADIKAGDYVLEPSAGSGNIADLIAEKYSSSKLDVVEKNSSLSEILLEKGHNVVDNDFIKYGGVSYDKIIMNPPFENGQDVDHVKHAYELLKSGGRIVAIMSEHPFFESDKKSVNFRDWLESVGGTSEKLPEGSFKESDRSTGVNTRIVVINKIVKKQQSNNEYFKGTNNKNKPSNGAETNIKGRREIIGDLEKTLNIPFRAGRIQGKNVLGLFKRKQEVVRTKLSNDMDTISHEVGHYLDKLFSIRENVTESKYLKELRALGSEQSKDTSKQKTEGIAEFVRFYLTSENAAKEKAPNFYSYFQDVLSQNKDVNSALDRFKTNYREYMSASSQDRIHSSISIGEHENKKISFDKVMTGWVDELRPFQKFVKDVVGNDKISITRDTFKQAWLARGWQAKAMQAIKYGVYDSNFKKVSDSLEDILKPIKNKGNFRDYMVAKRAKELIERGVETGHNYDDVLNVINSLESSDFKKAFDGLQKYNDALLQKLVDSGFLSKTQKDNIQELNKDYVPFYRVLDGNNARNGVSKGFANLYSPVKKIKGSDRQIIDPLESIVKNTYYFINLAERNNVGRSMVELAENYEGMGKYVERVNPKFKATSFELNEIQKALEGYGADLENVDLDDILTIFRPIVEPSAKENVVTVYRDGNREMYQLEPDLYKATLFLDGESSNMLLNLLSKPASLLRAGAVLDPSFMTRNPVRDMFSAVVYSNYRFIPIVDTVKGMFHVIKKDDMYQKWLASGGGSASMVSLDRKYLQKSIKEMDASGNIVKAIFNTVKNPVEILRTISEVMEESTRLGEFSKGVKKDSSVEGILNAALSSRDVTLDFSRAGTYGKQANKIVAFFNATLQGTDKMVREFKNHPVRSTFRSTLYITLPSIILWALFHDDDRYKELPSWRRDLFWNIPTEDKIISIPKPFELGIIFGSLPERILSFAYDNDKEGMNEWAKSLLDGISPNILPTALQPAVEVGANYSFFRQSHIADEHLPTGLQYTSSNSEISKKIAKLPTLIGKDSLSPAKVDYAIKGYTGGLGSLGLQLIDNFTSDKKMAFKDYTKLPGLKGFFTEPYTSSRTVNKFYDELDKFEAKNTVAVREYKVENGLTDKEYQSFSRKKANANYTDEDGNYSFRPDGISENDFKKLKALRAAKDNLKDLKDELNVIENSKDYTKSEKELYGKAYDVMRLYIIKNALGENTKSYGEKIEILKKALNK